MINSALSKFIPKFIKKSFNEAVYFITDKPLEVTPIVQIFNFLCFLNGSVNILGVFPLLTEGKNLLAIFNAIAAFGFFILWFMSKYRFVKVSNLYWFFTFLILGFLTLSFIIDFGSRGGSQFYFILGALLCLIVAETKFQRCASIAIYMAISFLLYHAEHAYPEFFLRYNPDFFTPKDSHTLALSMAANYSFVIFFIGIIIHKLLLTLNREKENSDRLLRNILPDYTALELKKHQKVRPRQYSSATIIFIDMVGFSKNCLNKNAEEVVRLLEYYYNTFDAIFIQNNIEKIKTIGDGYMAVGGIPQENETHYRDALISCMKIINYVYSAEEKAKRMKIGIDNMGVRIGVHTGELIAGVIGNNKFSYDVWGNSVNLASRLESGGEPGRINVSQNTYELVKDEFEFFEPKTMQVKNMGEVPVYVLKGLRATDKK